MLLDKIEAPHVIDTVKVTHEVQDDSGAPTKIIPR